MWSAHESNYHIYPIFLNVLVLLSGQCNRNDSSCISVCYMIYKYWVLNAFYRVRVSYHIWSNENTLSKKDTMKASHQMYKNIGYWYYDIYNSRCISDRDPDQSDQYLKQVILSFRSLVSCPDVDQGLM